MIDLLTPKSRTIFINTTRRIPFVFFVFSYCCQKWFCNFSSNIKVQKSNKHIARKKNISFECWLHSFENVIAQTSPSLQNNTVKRVKVGLAVWL